MARRLINTKKISHDEWLALRRNGIGGSDAACCVGMNPYKSLLTLYADKKELSKEVESNEAMRLGNDLEDYVAKRFEEATGKKVRNDSYMYQHDDYDFIIADVDRRIVGENAILEAKTMNQSYASKFDFELGEVPENYYCQAQHYLGVLGADRCYLAVLVLQKGIEIVTIERNDTFIDDLFKAEIEFWQEHVMKSEPPEPDGSESSMETVKELYSQAVAESEIYIPEVDEQIARYKSLSNQISALEGEKKHIQAVICSKLGIGGMGIGNEYGCSWKTQSRTNFDSKKLKEEMPEVYARYSSVSEYPVFRTKKLRGDK